jgi:hypothetical protein
LRLLLQQVWSGVCRETTAMARAWTTTLGSDAREAKERLDHKLRSQRQLVFKGCVPRCCSALLYGGSEPHHSHLYCTSVVASFSADLCGTHIFFLNKKERPDSG